MIEIEKIQVYGFEAAIRGMRNPMDSHDKSDSQEPYYCDECRYAKHVEQCPFRETDETFLCFDIGEKDMTLAKKLVKAGSDHRKFLRMISVSADINAPLYWWKEYDTYKVGTVANSCSTMHTIHKKPFTIEDFSFDRFPEDAYAKMPFEFMVVGVLEELRTKYAETGEEAYWRRMIQLLPQSYNQRRTVMLNYEVLRSMYHARKEHKLDEWRAFCEWMEKLPYAELITMV